MTQSSWSSYCLGEQFQSHQGEAALHLSWACKSQKYNNGHFNYLFWSWHMSPLHSSCKSVSILAFKIQSYSADGLLYLEWTQWANGCHYNIHHNSCDIYIFFFPGPVLILSHALSPLILTLPMWGRYCYSYPTAEEMEAQGLMTRVRNNRDIGRVRIPAQACLNPSSLALEEKKPGSWWKQFWGNHVTSK